MRILLGSSSSLSILIPLKTMMKKVGNTLFSMSLLFLSEINKKKGGRPTVRLLSVGFELEPKSRIVWFVN